MKVLVVGASGATGRFLVNRLRVRGAAIGTAPTDGPAGYHLAAAIARSDHPRKS